MQADESAEPSARPVRDANEPPPEPVAQEPDGVLIPKKACVALLCVPLAYLTWVALNVLYRMPQLVTFHLQLDMPVPAPWATQVLMKTSSFWLLFPVTLGLFIADIARRKRPSGAYVGGVFVGACLICWVLQAIVAEGSIAPIIQMMELLGKP